MPAPVEQWFAVLADGEAGLGAAPVLRPRAPQTLTHASGRPWLLGRWPEGALSVAAAGAAKAAVIGRCPITAAELTERLGRLGDIEDAERLVEGLAGSFHLVVSIGGRVRVRGSASAVRQVFHTRMAGTTVASSRADVLAAAAGTGIEERVLAARLLTTTVYPLQEQCVWQGVTRVPPDHCLVIESDGRAATRRWWRVPEPVRPLAEAFPKVRRALTAAVDSCTAAGGTVSADLSGGMDSTSLCFLAAAGPAQLVTTHWTPRDPANDDSEWARKAAAALPGARHLVADPQRTPLWFAEVTGSHPATDEPCGWVRDWGRLRDSIERMAAQSSRLHLMGGGGDELFSPLPHYLHDLFRIRPLSALARLRALRTRRPMGPLRPMLAELIDRTSFAAWLDDYARAPARPSDFSMAWGAPGGMPEWATPQAVEATRDLLRQVADSRPEPLSPMRGQHTALHCVRIGGGGLRLIDQAATQTGVPYAAPFLDDAVVEAALSVHTAERGTVDRYKPVLAAAMSQVVPAPLLQRPTIGEYSADLYAGLRRHRGELLELFDDGLLAAKGLIDPAVIRAFLLRPHPQSHTLDPLTQTLACEIWLRSRSGPGLSPGQVPATTGEPR